MPDLIVKLGDREINRVPFYQDFINIGRSNENGLVIPNLGVSKKHAQIRREREKFVITDLNSTNGTYLNDERIISQELRHGDVIQIGKHSIVFENSEAVKDKSSLGAPQDFGITFVMDKEDLQEAPEEQDTFVASILADSFHKNTCDMAGAIDDKKKIYFSKRENAIESGRKPCKICKP